MLTFFPYDIFIKAIVITAAIGALLYFAGTSFFPNEWATFEAFFDQNSAGIDWDGLGRDFSNSASDLQEDLMRTIERSMH